MTRGWEGEWVRQAQTWLSLLDLDGVDYQNYVAYSKL
jgi:hypothetical protein